MVGILEHIFAAYLLVWTVAGFVIVFRVGIEQGRDKLRDFQEQEWYRTVGVINSFVVFALCLLVLLG
jgi:hypothetical protein